MTAAIDHDRPRGNRMHRRPLAAWSGIVGALFLAGATYLILLSPQGSDPDAPRSITEFYAEGGSSGGLLFAEPLSILGAFLILWFLGNLASMLHPQAPNSDVHPILAGGTSFVILALASIVTQTTLAGSQSFFPAFQVDPHTSLALSHLGYVLMAGAMVGAAILLARAGSMIRRGATAPRWLGSSAYALVPMSMLSMFFVYLPVALFLLWIMLVGVSLLSNTR